RRASRFRRLAAASAAAALIAIPISLAGTPAHAVPPTAPTVQQTFSPWYTDDPQDIDGLQGTITGLEGTTRVDVYVTPTPADPASWVQFCAAPVSGGATIWFCDTESGGSLQPGLNYLAATATNIDGESPLGNLIEILLVDSPVITSHADGALTNDNTPDFFGTADPILVGEIVDVREPIGPTLLCSGIVDAAGDWSCETSPALIDGTYDVFAYAGLSLFSPEQSLTIDTTPPAEAVITSPPPTGPPVGFVYPSQTNDPTPVISGTSEP